MTACYKRCRQIWISFLTLFSLFVLMNLSACSSVLSSKMPPGSVSMAKSYQEAIDGSDHDVDEGSSLTTLRTQVKPLNYAVINQVDNGDNIEELNTEFPRLPNPEIVLYVYPHFVGNDTEQIPVPGYATVFNLYPQDHYQLTKSGG
jgi:conjugative transfer region lipoprotein (TIGR03751 family)